MESKIANTVREDFYYEMDILNFPFKSIIKGNDLYSDHLFKEFTDLPIEPKLHLYLKQYVTEKEFKDYHHGHWSDDKDNRDLAGQIETKIRGHAAEFSNVLVSNRIDEKICGRFLCKTETIKILNKIKDCINGLFRYVSKNPNTNFYSNYGNAVANNIISLTGEINIKGLQSDILKYIVAETNNVFFHLSEQERAEMNDKWNILKIYVDDKIIDHIKTPALATTVSTLVNPTIIDEPIIRKLRALFDDYLWSKELNVSEGDFLAYWRTGKKEKYLPIKNKSDFVYLLEIKLKPFIRSGILQKSLIEAFDLKDYSNLLYSVKNKRLTDARKTINLMVKDLK